jgi:hypothetical protein
MTYAINSIAMPDPRSTQAAPPDDGHLGSYTLPEDVMSVPETDHSSKAPYLHTDIPPQRSGAGLGVILLMLVLVVVTIAIVYVVFRWMA